MMIGVVNMTKESRVTEAFVVQVPLEQNAFDGRGQGQSTPHGGTKTGEFVGGASHMSSCKKYKVFLEELTMAKL
jgi:hypothetical protein